MGGQDERPPAEVRVGVGRLGCWEIVQGTFGSRHLGTRGYRLLSGDRASIYEGTSVTLVHVRSW